jgi:RimJ/RimL family protein N-acetyltransferase
MDQPGNWRVSADATDDEVYPILARDPVWNCFALADLEPPLRVYSQFALASQGTSHALCLILRHPVIGEVIAPFGEEEGIAALLQEVAFPEHPLLQVQEAHMSLLQRYYQPETAAGWGSVLRMAVTPASWSAHRDEPPHPVQQLTAADVPALKAFYADYASGWFSEALFAQNLFFGAYEGAHLIAAGGTHVLAPRARLAVPGAILTAPHARRQGYATAIVSALVTQLYTQGFPLVVLNVFSDNEAAIRVYQRLGFRTQHRMLTGKGLRRPGSAPSGWRRDVP